MVGRALLIAAALMATVAAVANADPKDEVRAAIAKLEDSPNYTWRMTVMDQVGGHKTYRNQITGEVRNDGYGRLLIHVPEKKIFVLIYFNKKHEFAVYKDGTWKSLEDAKVQWNNDADVARLVVAPDLALSTKEISTAVDALADLKEIDTTYKGELTKEQVRQMLDHRVASSPEKDALPEQVHAIDAETGHVNYSVKDGVLTKMETHLDGTVRVDQNRNVKLDRTITTEFTDVNSTKIEVPEKVLAVLAK